MVKLKVNIAVEFHTVFLLKRNLFLIFYCLPMDELTWREEGLASYFIGTLIGPAHTLAKMQLE